MEDKEPKIIGYDDHGEPMYEAGNYPYRILAAAWAVIALTIFTITIL